MNLQTGAFGDPTKTETLILFWAKMEELHYPGANSTKTFLEKRLEQEQAAAQAQMLAQQQLQQAQGGLPMGMAQPGGQAGAAQQDGLMGQALM